MQLESPCRFCLCPSQLAALHQVLKVIFFETSQSRSHAACLRPGKDGLQATGSLRIPCTDHRSAQHSDWIHLFLPVALVPRPSVLGWHVPTSLPSYGSSVRGLPQVMLRKALQADSSVSTCRAGTVFESWDFKWDILFWKADARLRWPTTSYGPPLCSDTQLLKNSAITWTVCEVLC